MSDPLPKLLITGATSHLGCHLVERLLAEGAWVRCMMRSESSRARLPAGDYETAYCDILDADRRAGCLEGIEAVVHLAHVRHSHAIVEACRRASVSRLVVISSTRKFTQFPDETSERVEEGEAADEAGDLDWTILRPSMIFGDSRDRNLAPLVKTVQRKIVFPLIGNGAARMQPVFVLDVVDAILQTLRRPHTLHRDYNLAGPEPITLAEMMHTMRDLTGSNIRFIPVPLAPALLAAKVVDLLRRSKAPGLTARIQRLKEDKVFDIASARNDLDYAPRAFKEALRQKLVWLEQGR